MERIQWFNHFETCRFPAGFPIASHNVTRQGKPPEDETAEKVPMTDRRQGCDEPLTRRSELFPPTPAQYHTLIYPFVPLSAKPWRTFPLVAVVPAAGAPCA